MKRTRLKLGSLCTVNTLTTASISRSSARRWLPGPTSYAGLSGDSASAPLAAANASGGATAPAAAAADVVPPPPGCRSLRRFLDGCLLLPGSPAPTCLGLTGGSLVGGPRRRPPERALPGGAAAAVTGDGEGSGCNGD